jgi:hypothetical protein
MAVVSSILMLSCRAKEKNLPPNQISTSAAPLPQLLLLDIVVMFFVGVMGLRPRRVGDPIVMPVLRLPEFCHVSLGGAMGFFGFDSNMLMMLLNP